MTSQHCIACGYAVTYPIYTPDDPHPLSVMQLPNSEREARNLPRFPMEFHACARCGHVFNRQFDYRDIQYETNSNLMFNHGSGWQSYMQELIGKLLAERDWKNKTVIEIGCGNGHFLKALQEREPAIRAIGFEPGIETANAQKSGLEVYKDYFIAERDLPKYKPDLLICRHVLEHLPNPRDFVTEIAFWCNRHHIFPLFLAEVPCIEKAIAQARINDYLYEHVSNFTRLSLRRMFELSDYKVHWSETVYGDEVVVQLAAPQAVEQMHAIATQSGACHSAIMQQIEAITATLAKWRDEGKRIAFWGGTGKSASLLNGLKLDTANYPLVVDSDDNKQGFFVPGTGQEIRDPDILKAEPADILVITTQWRAKDIYAEAGRRKLPLKEVYVILNGALTLYHGEEI